MMDDDDRYDLDAAAEEVTRQLAPEPPPEPSRRPASTAARNLRAAKERLVDSLPRLIAYVVITWLVLLCHVLWPEWAECRAWVHGVQGDARVMIPNTSAPDPSDCWTTLWPDRILLPGDQFSVAPGGGLDIRFYERSFVHLNENTRARLVAAHFDRRSGGRRRTVALETGSIYVRSASPVSRDSRFAVQVGDVTVDGYEAFYTVDARQVSVLRGTVTVSGQGHTNTVAEGQVLDLRRNVIRPLAGDDRQRLLAADGRVPKVATGDAVKIVLVNWELGLILRRSAALLKLLGHKAGDGNPFLRFSLFNSSRRAQALKRMADVHTALLNLADPPASFRLDDYQALGINQERANFMRQAFYRGQFMEYRRSADGRDFRLVAYANDRNRTKITCDSSGVKTSGRR